MQQRSNNSNAPEQSQAIGELQRVSVSGDWNRCAAKPKISAALQSLSVRVHNLKIYYALGSGIYEFPHVSQNCS